MFKLIFAMVGFILAGAGFFLYTKPAYDQAQTASAEIAQYDAALDKATELQTIKQSLLSRYNSFNPADLERLQKLLPDHVDNVRLILDLDSMAARHGISLQNVDVSTSKSGNTASQTAIGAIGTSNQKYDSLNLKFTTRSTYTNFLQFMADLESSLRIVDLVSLAITTDTTVAQPGGRAEPVYGFDITLRTYWLK